MSDDGRDPRERAEMNALAERGLVAKIRLLCARELGQPPEFNFFHMDHEEGEQADAALLRLFVAEYQAQYDSRGVEPSVDEVILTLCHG